jgi:hypothetical protein
VDLSITVDYSDAFYRAELVLRAASGGSVSSLSGSSGSSDDADPAAVIELMQDVAPASVDYSQKQSTSYHFTDL